LWSNHKSCYFQLETLAGLKKLENIHGCTHGTLAKICERYANSSCYKKGHVLAPNTFFRWIVANTLWHDSEADANCLSDKYPFFVSRMAYSGEKTQQPGAPENSKFARISRIFSSPQPAFFPPASSTPNQPFPFKPSSYSQLVGASTPCAQSKQPTKP
jgi:hypothetical protein